jgi:3-oxoacyl-[acyl-carrier-protein] synthase III/acyl carrier protein
LVPSVENILFTLTILMNPSVGISSLALSFPSIIRTNEYWQNKYPGLFAQTKPRIPRASSLVDFSTANNGLDIWSMAVRPYLSDPFRGNIERRVLGLNESSLTLEYQAAKDALEAAKLSADDVELMIVSSLFCEHVGTGNASDLAQQLKLRCPAWNLESTCSSALVALQNAHALVQAGIYRNVLVVVSQMGSNTVDEEDTLSWSMGDGAGAFVVDWLKPTQGILGTKIVSTAATSGAYLHELTTDPQGKPRICTRTGENANMLAQTAVDFVRESCYGAIAAAGVTLEQINFFAFNTPTAWYAGLCTKALNIQPERTINLYPRYANIGPVIAIANLYHGVLAGKIQENDLVLVYTNGAAATAAATVMRWGDVAIGQMPTPPISVTQEQERIHLTVGNNVSPEKLLVREKVSFSREEILASQPSERQQILENYLIRAISNLLKLSIAELNSQQSLAYLIDSLVALELRKKIDNDLLVQVPMEKFFQNNSVGEIARFLHESLAISQLVMSKASLSLEVEQNTEEVLI